MRGPQVHDFLISPAPPDSKIPNSSSLIMNM